MTAESREYIKEIDDIPLEEKHKTEVSDCDKDKKENLTAQLFREIEALDQDHDKITVLMPHMSLADPGTSSHNGTPSSDRTLSDTSPTMDSLSELIEVFEEVAENDHKCGNCMMPVKNMSKHISLNKCKTLPFPHTNRTAKTSTEQEKIWADLEDRPGDDPAPSR